VEFLLEPFQHSIAQRALVEVVILGAVCGPLGAWVILYHQSYAAESLAHGLLPGLVLAALAGLPLILGAAAGVALAAALIALAARDSRIGSDVAVAVVITALFGAGALLALVPSSPARLEELLFGDLLGVSGAELAAAAALAAAVAAALALSHRGLALVAFDRQTAPVLGARPGLVELGLLLVLAVMVTAAVQALGNLLLVALLIAPAAAALRLCRRLGPAMALSGVLGVVAGVGGLYASHYLELAAGASIALAAIATFVLTLPVRAAPRQVG
jgi:manganese transport system permease protein